VVQHLCGPVTQRDETPQPEEDKAELILVLQNPCLCSSVRNDFVILSGGTQNTLLGAFGQQSLLIRTSEQSSESGKQILKQILSIFKILSVSLKIN
jgi:hypothetical protein